MQEVLLMTRVEQLFLLKPLSSSCWVTVCLFGSRMFATKSLASQQVTIVEAPGA